MKKQSNSTKDTFTPENEIKKLEKDIEILIGNSKHGNCCTCVECHNYHDECKCGEINLLKVKIQAIKQTKQFYENKLKVHGLFSPWRYDLNNPEENKFTPEQKKMIEEVIEEWRLNSIIEFDDECLYCSRHVANIIIMAKELKKKLLGEE